MLLTKEETLKVFNKANKKEIDEILLLCLN